jgi:mRNA-degrading endonuclease YafQ of YafQ-DinJ toxin-antitoxin module
MPTDNEKNTKKDVEKNDDDEDEDDQTFLRDFDDFEKEIVDLKGTTAKAKSTMMKTIEIERKKKDLENKLKSEQAKREKKEKDMAEIDKMTTTLRNDEAERKRLDEEYKKKLKSAAITREASKTELRQKEARLLDLEIKQTKIANLFAELKKAEKVDICFMLDATGSMSLYIAEAKNVIHKVIDKLKLRFQDFELRASFVGYRDHSDGPERVIVYNFDQNIDSFKTFVSNVEPKGGQDQCEDIFGGLEVNRNR